MLRKSAVSAAFLFAQRLHLGAEGLPSEVPSKNSDKEVIRYVEAE